MKNYYQQQNPQSGPADRSDSDRTKRSTRMLCPCCYAGEEQLAIGAIGSVECDGCGAKIPPGKATATRGQS